MTDRFVDHFGEDVCRERPFFNFGAGNWKHPHWQNIDLEHPKYPQNKPDVVYDAFSKDPFPLEEGTAKLFYFSQVNEHLTDEVNRFVFGEVFRCLEKDGMVRICYPDLDLANRAHAAGDRSFFLYDWVRGPQEFEVRRDFPLAQLWLDFFATRAQRGSPDDGNRKHTEEEVEGMIGRHGYGGAADAISGNMLVEVQQRAPGCHINYWTPAKLGRFLDDAGFEDITVSSYLQSACPPMRDPEYFDVRLPAISGYIEAWKR